MSVERLERERIINICRAHSVFVYLSIGNRSLCYLKKNVLTHEGHVVNKVYTYDHARFESDLSVDEKNQLAKLGRMGSTAQNVENGLSVCL